MTARRAPAEDADIDSNESRLITPSSNNLFMEPNKEKYPSEPGPMMRCFILIEPLWKKSTY